MIQDLAQTDLSEILGLDTLNDAEKTVYLSKIADAVMDVVLLRLTADLSTDQVEALEQYLETDPEPEVMVEHLATHHKNFSIFLKEEIGNLRSEIVDMAGLEVA